MSVWPGDPDPRGATSPGVGVSFSPPAHASAVELSLFDSDTATRESARLNLGYELDHCPEWVHIPIAGLLRLLDASPSDRQ